MPTFDELKKFLSQKCQILETVNYSSNRNKTNEFHSRPLGKTVQTNRGANLKSLLNVQSNFTCPVCRGNHNVPFCDEFKKCIT